MSPRGVSSGCGKFLSTPSARRATSSSTPNSRTSRFLSTPSARRATWHGSSSPARSANFYPRPPRGGRRFTASLRRRRTLRFLSTPSARRATNDAAVFRQHGEFLSTPSARRATLSNRLWLGRLFISIHALREEGDLRQRKRADRPQNFYPRPPRGGRPVPLCAGRETPKKFLSTPSARRATAKTETKSLFSYKLYNILHEFRRALIYNGSKNYPNHAK